MEKIGLILLSYLTGSIPFSYLVAHFSGKLDLRKYGNGKVSPSSVAHAMGKIPAGLAGLGDLLKGTAVVLLARSLRMPEPIVACCGIAAIVGHDWPIYLKFRGGRGIATSMGTLLVVAPPLLGIIIIPIIWGGITRNLGLGVGLGIFILPILAWLFRYPGAVIFLTAGITILMVISRLQGIWKITKNRKEEFWSRLLRDASYR